MSTPSSSLDEKIKELEQRFMLENESKDKDTIPRDFINLNSTTGTCNPRRPGNCKFCFGFVFPLYLLFCLENFHISRLLRVLN